TRKTQNLPMNHCIEDRPNHRAACVIAETELVATNHRARGYKVNESLSALNGKEAGAFGRTITAVAVIDTAEKGYEIGEKMVQVFLKIGNLKSTASVKKLDKVGARLIKSM
ncbi:hypothetical protein ISN44_As04g036960, partial [Arabidopsis suecica]